MKSTIILLALAGVLVFPALSRAQGPVPVAAKTIENADVTLSLEMARNMLKAGKGLTNSFADMKGDFLQKDDSGNSYYTVKDFNLNTDSQYVIQRTSGDYNFAAIFKQKDANDKIPMLAFTAFTGGIITVAGSNFTVARDDAAQPASTLKYYLKVKDIKIASFTFNVDTKEGTFIVAVQ
jgi:FlaG/FlaF family flagellin (archaellin)